MTKEEFRKLTEQTLILDGATGSNLMASGMPRGICTETWVIDHKDIIQNLQRAYIKAGSQVIYAPTFGGNRLNLEKHGLADRIEEINRTLVGYSKELAGNGAVFIWPEAYRRIHLISGIYHQASPLPEIRCRAKCRLSFFP